MSTRIPLRRILLVVLLLAGFIAACYRYFLYRENVGAANTPLPDILALHPTDRILVVAPHCDDETLACGGVIARATDQGIPVKVVIVTNGDGFKYAAVLEVRKLKVKPADYFRFADSRQKESLVALQSLGVQPDRVTFLGYPDRGTDEMWLKFWRKDGGLYFSPFTRSDRSPYANSYTPNVAYCGESELHDLREIIEGFKPTLVFAPHPNDAHPDHWATHAFVTAAIESLRSALPRTRLLTYLVHRGSYPAPLGLKESKPMPPPHHLIKGNTDWLRFPLSPRETDRKARALLQYRSQLPLLRRYMMSFVCANELFGVYPEKVPTVPRKRITIDGDFSDWNGVPVALPDPTADTVSRTALGMADIEDLRLARTDKHLFVQLQLRDSISHSTVYRLHLHAFITDADDEEEPFKFEINFHKSRRVVLRFHSPEDTSVSARFVRARSRKNRIEFAIPLYALGNPDRFMIAATTLMENINVDKTAFLLVPLTLNPQTP